MAPCFQMDFCEIQVFDKQNATVELVSALLLEQVVNIAIARAVDIGIDICIGIDIDRDMDIY